MLFAVALDPAPAPEADPLAPLVEAARRGDRDAYRELLLAVQPRIRNLVRYLVRGDGEVDDLAQEALVAVVRGLPGFRGEGAFRAWVDRITARLVFAHLRRAKREPELKNAILRRVVDEEARPPDAYLRRRELARALDAIPDEQRAALVLHHVLGMSVREVAEELAAPRETVRSRLRLGMSRLRALLSPREAP